ncbi:MAG: hydrogenase maturation protease [Anaerolineales bacterium]|nr:hydrogenase maturation protease [Anaerolineales bacterium]MCX7754141.1 hydrogenase maturation protease [Anaerolineales bacterium]MDW8278055.1 hydrogenase maturation protease [Anaerolineales bacterium]
MNRTLILGYGNPDRQDDGVAWHIQRALALELGLAAPTSYEEEFPQTPWLDFQFYLQLTPEMAEDLRAYERVCFVDAHTGSIPEDVRLVSVESEFQRSPFTHHLTPQSLLSMCETLYGRKPEAVLLSARGYHFEFQRDLSPETAALVPQAVHLIRQWLEQKPVSERLP